jgi:hypothetical protein
MTFLFRWLVPNLSAYADQEGFREPWGGFAAFTLGPTSKPFYCRGPAGWQGVSLVSSISRCRHSLGLKARLPFCLLARIRTSSGNGRVQIDGMKGKIDPEVNSGQCRSRTPSGRNSGQGGSSI